MLASVELPDDFKLLNQQYRGLVQALLADIELLPIRVEVAPTLSGNFRGFDPAKFYLVASGTVTVRYSDRAVYLLEEGDILLPDVTGSRDPDAAVFYGSEAGASLNSFSALEFMQQVFARPSMTKLWTRLLVTYSGMLLRLTAMHTQVDVVTTPGFALYEPGEVIITQGERAQFVFNLTSGLADVMVDGVPVGIISPGEIFGAMAALTHADRSATVRARSRCSVVKVPTSQFTELIKSNPATIQALLTDMANSIVSLNEQVVQQRVGSNSDTQGGDEA
ncbi:cyclic nucleotide-binding domain-containing protein [Congregibacter sp.]|uniref:cyclic nucleotide-binding domain-containing protein n=1 Tax=Congregibacter sp. TaxID=2744308 RepID=UPI003F6AA931